MLSNLRSFFFVVVCMTSVLMAQAQPGTIRGKVTNGTTGEVLLGATVRLLEGVTVKGGAYTDLEGNYTIKAPAGTYTLIISYISFVDDTIKNVALAANAVVFNETLMFEQMSVREDLQVEITTTRNQATAVTLYNKKRNAINAIDGVSYDLIQRTGDANVAGAVQRIVGVTVSDGKYVFVRGLGDRYSKTTLNGAEIPSLDPNRNAVQMDIFPSNLIDNIIVYKNFTPDLPGSFSGGLVDVRTKDFPDRFTLNFTAGTAFNPQANLLKDEFLTYNTGKRDWLGVDDGTRAVPEYVKNLPNGIPSSQGLSVSAPDYAIKAEQIDRATSALLNTRFDPVQGNSTLDQNYQLSLGNQMNLFGKPFGYIASISYRNEFSAYPTNTVGRYTNTGTAANPATSLTPNISTLRQSGQQDVLWGGLVKFSYKPFSNHKFSLNVMHNQSGTSSALFQSGRNTNIDSDAFVEDRVLAYLQRQLDVFQLQGAHVFGKLKADWIGSLAFSSQDEPDLRFFSNTYVIEPDDNGVPTKYYDIRASNDQIPARFFRNLQETNFDGGLHFEHPIKVWNGNEGKVKFGGAYTFKDRTFEENRYEVSFSSRSAEYDGVATNFFTEENFGILDTVRVGSTTRYDFGYFFQDASEARNTYTGRQDVYAAYAMIELPITTRFKAITGARYEGTQATTTSQDPTVPQGVLDLNDILPSLQLIYAVRENMNVRLGYSRTLARPSFREFTPFASFDFVGDFVTVGNVNLQRTLIDNMDLRWEWYTTPSELFSISAFYKNFTNPIERILDLRAQNPEFTFRNIDQSLVYGLEFEFKKNFAFVSDALSRLELGGNLALVQSRVEILEAEYNAIIQVDPTRSRIRPMYGQSPYSANAELSYTDREKLGFQASVSYNIFGPRLTLVSGADPDVYEQPRGLLNVSLSKDFGPRITLRVRGSNLLNPAYRQAYTFNDKKYDFENYRTGRSFSAALSVKL